MVLGAPHISPPKLTQHRGKTRCVTCWVFGWLICSATPFPTHSPELCGSTGAFGFVCGFGECRFASAYKIYGILSTLNPLCSLVVCSLFCATLSLSLVSCFWQGACRTCADPDFATDFFGGFLFSGGAQKQCDAGGQRGTRVHWTERHKSLEGRVLPVASSRTFSLFPTSNFHFHLFRLFAA